MFMKRSVFGEELLLRLSITACCNCEAKEAYYCGAPSSTMDRMVVSSVVKLSGILSSLCGCMKLYENKDNMQWKFAGIEEYEER